jgi:short-subunit dehydrogenase
VNVAGARVVITGGSEGIGLATAQAFARKGARLVLLARDERKLEGAAAAVAEAAPGSPEVRTASCDVTDGDAVGRTFREIQGTLGGIDVLVNNAGISVYGEAEKTPLEAARRVMEVDYFGALNCTRAAVPMMRAQGSGVLVTVASAAALYGVPFLSAYGASKAALVAYSQSLRAEVASAGIKVVVVYPGYTQTGLFAKEQTFGQARRPPGPYRPPETVARAIVKAVERGRREVVLSPEGKGLLLARCLLSWLVDPLLARLAAKLRGM